MKEFLLLVLKKLVSIRFIWLLFYPFSRAGLIIHNARKSVVFDEKSKRLREQIFKNLVVLNGPFKGLKYHSFEAMGSQFYPKLLGSYEKELWPFFESKFNKNYLKIIDIGSAEGYYAVGLAKLFPQAQVLAYDTSKKARKLVSSMAKLNGVENRLQINSTCGTSDLIDLDHNQATLIISDCEGFEEELFTEEIIGKLNFCDLIIELHYEKNYLMLEKLSSIFNETHDIEVVSSISDFQKLREYNFSELANLTSDEQKICLFENRNYPMDWLILHAKN